jgi:hypothetical protein
MNQTNYLELGERLFEVETFLFDIVEFFPHVVHVNMCGFEGDVGLACGLLSEFIQVVSAGDER